MSANPAAGAGRIDLRKAVSLLGEIAGAFALLAPPAAPSVAESGAAAQSALVAGRRLVELACQQAPGEEIAGDVLGFAVEVVATAATLRAFVEFRTPGDLGMRAAACLRFSHEARELAHRLAQ